MKEMLHLEDSLKLSEDAPIEQIVHRNHADIFNSKGEFLMRTFNIVVNRGRLFTLSKVFNRSFGNADLNAPEKFVSVFAVGDGGALPESLSTPVSVNLKDTALYNHIKFREDNDTLENVDGDVNNEQYWENTKYKDIKDIVFNAPDGDEQIMYCEMTLEIAFSECHGKNVNELGLFIADHDLLNNTKSNWEMFSHISFASLPNMNVEDGGGDSYIVKYRVYA